MSNKLKPCPFCGTKPHHITADLLTRPCFYYECENKTCHAAEKGWHDTEQEAIDAWNTRPIEDALQARIAELEKKSMQCPRCGDPITNELGDNPICGACALASDLAVMTLQARITELEKLLSGNPQTMTTREMLAMPLNSEIALCNGCYIMRVPGGWIYKDTYNYSDGCGVSAMVVFVPEPSEVNE